MAGDAARRCGATRSVMVGLEWLWNLAYKDETTFLQRPNLNSYKVLYRTIFIPDFDHNARINYTLHNGRYWLYIPIPFDRLRECPASPGGTGRGRQKLPEHTNGRLEQGLREVSRAARQRQTGRFVSSP